MEIIILGIRWENTGPGTEFSCNFFVGIGPAAQFCACFYPFHNFHDYMNYQQFKCPLLPLVGVVLKLTYFHHRKIA